MATTEDTATTAAPAGQSFMDTMNSLPSTILTYRNAGNNNNSITIIVIVRVEWE